MRNELISKQSPNVLAPISEYVQEYDSYDKKSFFNDERPTPSLNMNLSCFGINPLKIRKSDEAAFISKSELCNGLQRKTWGGRVLMRLVIATCSGGGERERLVL